jgi:hypothetical protein
VTEVPANAGELAERREIAGDGANESPLRHHLLTEQRLRRVYLVCPSSRPIRSDVGDTPPAGEPGEAERVGSHQGMLWHLSVVGRVARGTEERRRVLAGNSAIQR